MGTEDLAHHAPEEFPVLPGRCWVQKHVKQGKAELGVLDEDKAAVATKALNKRCLVDTTTLICKRVQEAVLLVLLQA